MTHHPCRTEIHVADKKKERNATDYRVHEKNLPFSIHNRARVIKTKFLEAPLCGCCDDAIGGVIMTRADVSLCPNGRQDSDRGLYGG